MAEPGERLLRAARSAHLATIRPDGSPRIHPVPVAFHGAGLYTSAALGTREAYDLRRDGRFALHAFPPAFDDEGAAANPAGEFMVGGRAEEVADPAERAAVVAELGIPIRPRDPVWHLLLDRAIVTRQTGDRPLVDRWRAPADRPPYAPGAIAVEPLEPGHWPDVRRILEAGIATGDATLDPEAPEWSRFDEVHRPDGRVVALLDGRVVGWSALSPYSKRDVYSGVAWERVYVAEDARGRGVGRALVEHQVGAMPVLGLWSLLAGVIRENGPSLALHRRVGFRVIGVQERLARDGSGRWRDVVLLERRGP